jgi:hypothetical protein
MFRLRKRRETSMLCYTGTRTCHEMKDAEAFCF